ncbi:MAG TPA: type II secretion system F family protein [Methanoregulaceae archaeon]|nr:type II secretion system F family protein [Methanoregulaceae archaeon]HQJ88252.1 type II secretion system F family protein [Methanoregulaceae archaeon]
MILGRQIQAWVARDPGRFQRLNADLVSARAGVTVERYLATAILASIAVALVFLVVGFIVTGIVIAFTEAQGTSFTNPTGLHLPYAVGPVPMSLILQVVGALIGGLLAASITYMVALQWPSITKGTRASKINMTLHNAVAYMFAMRKGGAELLTIFRSISENANIYGEVALEFRQVVRDADFFGLDVVSAIRQLHITTPSNKLKDFLQDLLSVIESGGDMTHFLDGRVHLFQEEARYEQKNFLSFLALVAESYVTLFVAGPLFLIIIMVVMGMMGGSAVIQLAAVVYLMLPVGTSIFMVMIDLVSIKSEVVRRTGTKESGPPEFSDVTVVPVGGEEALFARLAKYDQSAGFRNFLRDPLRAFTSRPIRVLFLTLPVGLGYIFFMVSRIEWIGNLEAYVGAIDDHIVIGLLIILLPFSIFFEVWHRRLSGIESAIPEFLDRMAGINQVGLTVAQAISIMMSANLGVLSHEIRRINRDMDWGANFSEALGRFEERVTTPIIARMVTLITKATEMSSQINEVLNIAASDARMSDVLKRERLAEMFIYVAIVYLSFFVFIFVIAILNNQFLVQLSKMDTSGLAQGGQAFSGLGSIPLGLLQVLLYHACLFQGFFSGLIAGQMGESSVLSGIKHACIMLLIALVAFNTVASPPV